MFTFVLRVDFCFPNVLCIFIIQQPVYAKLIYSFTQYYGKNYIPEEAYA